MWFGLIGLTGVGGRIRIWDYAFCSIRVRRCLKFDKKLLGLIIKK